MSSIFICLIYYAHQDFFYILCFFFAFIMKNNVNKKLYKYKTNIWILKKYFMLTKAFIY